LFNLNAESRVVVCGLWFQKIFSFLAAGHCRVALIYDTEILSEQSAKILSRWHILEKKTMENVRRMTERLFRLNSRRPLLCLRSLNMETVRQEVLELRKGNFPDTEPCFIQIESPFLAHDFSAAHPDIMKKLSESKFDGMLVNDPDAFHFLRKFLPDAPCGYIDLKRQRDQGADSRVFYSDFDLQGIGQQAVRTLLNPSAGSSFQEFHAEIHTWQANDLKPSGNRFNIQPENRNYEQN